MPELFSVRLKEARGLLPQSEVCKDLGIKQGTYSTWELGKYEPPLAKLVELAKYFKVTTEWLLGIDDNKPTSQHSMPVSSGKCSECATKDKTISDLSAALARLASKWDGNVMTVHSDAVSASSLNQRRLREAV